MDSKNVETISDISQKFDKNQWDEVLKVIEIVQEDCTNKSVELFTKSKQEQKTRYNQLDELGIESIPLEKVEWILNGIENVPIKCGFQISDDEVV